LELIDIYINDKNQKDYDLFSFVDEHDLALGYICYGKTPMTESTFDMYWIAVNPECHNKGIGKQLLEYVEKEIVSLGGKLIVVETSSREDYLNTRMFYIKSDYKELSRIKNYYKVNDDLVVYGKYI
jgi:ribosomal protein S18 acetylase RimI-like enzyme